MANFQSQYTGAQIDEAVGKALGGGGGMGYVTVEYVLNQDGNIFTTRRFFPIAEETTYEYFIEDNPLFPYSNSSSGLAFISFSHAYSSAEGYHTDMKFIRFSSQGVTVNTNYGVPTVTVNGVSANGSTPVKAGDIIRLTHITTSGGSN